MEELERKSKYLIFFQGRMFRGCSKPLKWLKERFKDCNVSFPTFQNHLGTLPSICYWKGLNIVIHIEILGKFPKIGNSSKLQERNLKFLNFGRVELIFPFEINKLLPERMRALILLSLKKMSNSNISLRLMEERYRYCR